MRLVFHILCIDFNYQFDIILYIGGSTSRRYRADATFVGQPAVNGNRDGGERHVSGLRLQRERSRFVMWWRFVVLSWLFVVFRWHFAMLEWRLSYHGGLRHSMMWLFCIRL